MGREVLAVVVAVVAAMTLAVEGDAWLLDDALASFSA
jgi:hypothetical protein